MASFSDSLVISDGTMKSNRVGLSEYTAKRLAELRARRAEADDTGSFSASSTAAGSAAEVTENDVHVTASSPSITAQHPLTSTACSSSASDSNNVVPTVPATQLPTNIKRDLDSSSTPPKPLSHGISAPATAVSNGISETSPDAADVTVKQRQMFSIKSESIPANEQRKIDRQDFKLSSPRADFALNRPTVQQRDLSQPNPFLRMSSHSNDTAATAIEVGAVNKMVRFFLSYSYCLSSVIHFTLLYGASSYH